MMPLDLSRLKSVRRQNIKDEGSKSQIISTEKIDVDKDEEDGDERDEQEVKLAVPRQKGKKKSKREDWPTLSSLRLDTSYDQHELFGDKVPLMQRREEARVNHRKKGKSSARAYFKYMLSDEKLLPRPARLKARQNLNHSNFTDLSVRKRRKNAFHSSVRREIETWWELAFGLTMPVPPARGQAVVLEEEQYALLYPRILLGMQRELELQGYVELVDYEVDSEELLRCIECDWERDAETCNRRKFFGFNRFKAAILAVSQSIIENHDGGGMRLAQLLQRMRNHVFKGVKKHRTRLLPMPSYGSQTRLRVEMVSRVRERPWSAKSVSTQSDVSAVDTAAAHAMRSWEKRRMRSLEKVRSQGQANRLASQKRSNHLGNTPRFQQFRAGIEAIPPPFRGRVMEWRVGFGSTVKKHSRPMHSGGHVLDSSSSFMMNWDSAILDGTRPRPHTSGKVFRSHW